MDEIPHFLAWIDYLIVSDDPADQALATEFRTREWAMREIIDALGGELRDGDATALMNKWESERREYDKLTEQIHERAQILAAAGASPANEAQVAADWRGRACGVRKLAAKDIDEVLQSPNKPS